MVKDIASNREHAMVLAGAVQIIDWMLNKDQFEGYALNVLGLLDLEHEPVQDYMSRDSDTQELSEEL
jgi:hypothetical protein